MGKRGRLSSVLGTYIVCVISSFLLGLAANLLYSRDHEDQVLLPVVSGMVLTVLGVGGSFLARNPRLRLVLMSAGAFGIALFFSGFGS